MTSLAHQTKANVWVLAGTNIVLSLILAYTHLIFTTKLFDWWPFLGFVGEQPFQSRVLPFLLADLVDKFHRLSDHSLAILFLAMDWVGILACVFFIWKTTQALQTNKRHTRLIFILFWWQMFATFVISPVHNYYYPYDMMSLAFIALAIWMIVTGQGLVSLLSVSILAMTNRETAIVIPFFYLAFNWPASKSVWRDFTIMLLACILVKSIIAMSLHVTSGNVSLYHVPGFLRFYYNFSFVTGNPKLMHTLNAVFAFGFAWVLLFMGGPADRRLRNMLWCFVPYLAGMAVVGNLSEIRIFAEFIPLMALLLAGKLADDEARAPTLVQA